MKQDTKRQLSVVIGALLLDEIVGDPPNQWHPVAWMGTMIGRLRQFAPLEGRLRPFLSGGLISLGGASLMWGAGRLLACLPEPARWLVETAVLKSAFSLRGLIRASEDVQHALQDDDLEQARHWLSWHLVSRDTSQLNANQVAAATIESVAENLSDSVIAPLFYYRLGGLPLALAYRYLNTCDAMLGYRDEREWLGKIPACVDDVLNFCPARLTAAGILRAKGMEDGDWERPLTIYQRDRQQTDSPNAGHPMSAMAGTLGVELEKVGQYKLGAGQRAPEANDIQRANRLLHGALAVCLGLIFLWPRFSRKKDDDSR